MRYFFIIAALIMATGSAQAEPDTSIQYRFQSGSTLFDTRYTLPFQDTDSFLTDVASQRSLGTFQKTTIVSTDEFIAAIGKRLAEFDQVSQDLRKVADQNLPDLVIKHAELTSLSDITNIELPPVGTEDTYDITYKIIDIRHLFKDGKLSQGLQQFTELEQLIKSAPANSRISRFAGDIQSLRAELFAPEGFVKGQALSNISGAFSLRTSKDLFMTVVVNRCIASPSCDQERFRQIVAISSIFGTTKEILKLKSLLEKSKFEVRSDMDLKSVIGGFSKANSLIDTCKASQSCDQSESLFRTTAKQAFRCSDSQTTEITDLIYPK